LKQNYLGLKFCTEVWTLLKNGVTEKNGTRPAFQTKVLMACASGGFNAIAFTPFERAIIVKVLNQSNESVFAIWKHIYRHEGFLSLFRGGTGIFGRMMMMSVVQGELKKYFDAVF